MSGVWVCHNAPVGEDGRGLVEHDNKCQEKNAIRQKLSAVIARYKDALAFPAAHVRGLRVWRSDQYTQPVTLPIFATDSSRIKAELAMAPDHTYVGHVPLQLRLSNLCMIGWRA